MVLSWDITEIVKKKNFISSKDKKDWVAFTKQMGNIKVKESDLLKENIEVNEVKKLDLHGFSLIEANRVVKNNKAELIFVLYLYLYYYQKYCTRIWKEIYHTFNNYKNDAHTKILPSSRYHHISFL